MCSNLSRYRNFELLCVFLNKICFSYWKAFLIKHFSSIAKKIWLQRIEECCLLTEVLFLLLLAHIFSIKFCFLFKTIHYYHLMQFQMFTWVTIFNFNFSISVYRLIKNVCLNINLCFRICNFNWYLRQKYLFYLIIKCFRN